MTHARLDVSALLEKHDIMTCTQKRMGLLLRAIRVGFSPPILNMVSKVYIPVLFPLTFLIALLALWMDERWSFGGGFLPEGSHLWVALASLFGSNPLALDLCPTRHSGQRIAFSYRGKNRGVGDNRYLCLQGILLSTANGGVLSVGFALNSLSFSYFGSTSSHRVLD